MIILFLNYILPNFTSIEIESTVSIFTRDMNFGLYILYMLYLMVGLILVGVKFRKISSKRRVILLNGSYFEYMQPIWSFIFLAQNKHE